VTTDHISADLHLRRVPLEDVELNVAVAGNGPALVLLHGWPHTWQVWASVLPRLAQNHTVIAPDLRGLGDSSRPATGYDAASIAGDIRGLLDALGIEHAALAAIDASVPAAFLLAVQHPERVSRIVLMESALPALPGAEKFFAAGPPWWFGFHAVPELAETVLVGHESAYLDYFLRSGTYDLSGIDPQIRDAFVAAYTGKAALRAGFEYYRAMPANAELIRTLLSSGTRLTVPTLAIGGNTVGDALYQQLRAVTDHLTGRLIPHCGHIVPLDQPQALLDTLLAFLH